MLSRAWVTLSAVSTAFPIVASLMPREAPLWLGVVDVGIAAALLATSFVVVAKGPRSTSGPVAEATASILRAAATGFLLLLVVFFVAGEAIKWSVLLPGLAWRGWLFVYVLPSWLALRRSS